MSDSLKSVAQAGASGNHGEAVLKELVEGGFDVSVLSRRSGQIPSEYASQVREVIVDYDDPKSLKEALESGDAVVPTLGSPAVGGPQRARADAAAASGAQRFIHSNIGCDQGNTLTRQLPVFTEKVKTEDHLIELVQKSSLSYIFIYSSLFQDLGLTNGSLANLKEKWVFFNYNFQGGNNAKHGCSFEKVDNDFVGLPKLSTEEMKALVMETTQANA